MANLYFNNAVNTSLSTLGNWWTNAGFTTPAGGLPTASDNCFIKEGINAYSGTLTCATVKVIGNLGEAWANIAEPVVNGNVILAPSIDFGSTGKIYDGIINGSVTYEVSYGGNIGGGTFNGVVGDPISGMSISGEGPVCIFNDDVYVASGGNFVIVTFNGRITFNGGYTWLAPQVEPDYPAISDVRAGVEYADGDLVGTLGGGTLSITVD